MSRWFEEVPKEEKMLIDKPIFPLRSTRCSAGYDFYVPHDFSLEPGEKKIIWTDLRAIMEEDEALFIYPRSSLAIKHDITLKNDIAVIDSDYLRNIGLPLVNEGKETVYFERWKHKLVQGIFQKYLVADNCNSTDERVGGMGSTG